MATRCNIGMMLPDGNIKKVYCHNDGDGAGEILSRYYYEKEKVEELINLGNMSSLGYLITTEEPHSFNNPVNGVTVYYGRDRGDQEEEAEIVSLEEWIKNTTWIDYYYLFSDDEWKVFNGNSWKLLDN